MKRKIDKSHGSPYDRGSADYYYYRDRNPHKVVDGSEVTVLTDVEVTEYNLGYDEQDFQKDFGDFL